MSVIDFRGITALKNKESELRDKLQQLEYDASDIENEITTVKDKIEKLTIQIQTESLPTHLYNAGCKLLEESGVFEVVNINGRSLAVFEHSPSLTELMEIEIND